MSQILNADGKKVEQPTKNHKFGIFTIPKNSHIKGFGTIDSQAEYPDIPNMYFYGKKEDAKIR